MKTKYLISKDENYEYQQSVSLFGGLEEANFKKFKELMDGYGIDCFNANWLTELRNLLISDLKKIMPGADDSELLRLAGKDDEFNHAIALRKKVANLPLYKKGAFDKMIEDSRVYTDDKDVIELAEKIKGLHKELNAIGIDDDAVYRMFRVFAYKPQTGYFHLEALERFISENQ